ncbi:MAG: hypothetical protein QM811_06075 [Pirellulales bacterium]
MDFSLDDFLKLESLFRGGGSLAQGLRNIQGMVPGLPPVDLGDFERRVARLFDIVREMTPEERRAPSSIDDDRRRDIAAASHTVPAEVDGLIEQFITMRDLMQNVAEWGEMEAARRAFEQDSADEDEATEADLDDAEEFSPFGELENAKSRDPNHDPWDDVDWPDAEWNYNPDNDADR